MLQALRIRDFRLLWAGGLVSSLGSWVLTLAIPTHIFLVTGSLRATGVVLNMPAWQARTPAIVGTGPLLSSANALNSVSSGTVRLIGGPLGGILLAANAGLSAVLIPFGIQRLGGSERTGFLLAGLGAGFLLGAPVIRLLLDRVQPGHLLPATLTATAAAYFALFTSSSLHTALPAAAGVGAFGSMSLVIPQTAMQRVIPNAVLGRIGAVFLAGEAAATLVGAATGPVLAQAAGLTATAATASLVTLAAAVLARLSGGGELGPLYHPVEDRTDAEEPRLP